MIFLLMINIASLVSTLGAVGGAWSWRRLSICGVWIPSRHTTRDCCWVNPRFLVVSFENHLGTCRQHNERTRRNSVRADVGPRTLLLLRLIATRGGSYEGQVESQPLATVTVARCKLRRDSETRSVTVTLRVFRRLHLYPTRALPLWISSSESEITKSTLLEPI
jgi:hypothetical protein